MYRWYVVNTYSGHENKVKSNLEHRASSLGQRRAIRSVVVPTETVSEMKDGQKVSQEKRTMPGYVLVNMDLNEDSWQLVKGTPGVTGFVGASNEPVPLTQPEVDRLLHREVAQKVATQIKLQAVGGQASPAPPVGPALGQHGINIMEFCKAFNAQTQQDSGTVIPVVITVYEDRSFTFVTKTPPAAVLIKQAIGLEKGSGEPHRNKVGQITKDQVRAIAEKKLQDLNAHDVDQASKIIEGTARSMGVEVV